LCFAFIVLLRYEAGEMCPHIHIAQGFVLLSLFFRGWGKVEVVRVWTLGMLPFRVEIPSRLDVNQLISATVGRREERC
jgi:hypothetical protein